MRDAHVMPGRVERLIGAGAYASGANLFESVSLKPVHDTDHVVAAFLVVEEHPLFRCRFALTEARKVDPHRSDPLPRKGTRHIDRATCPSDMRYRAYPRADEGELSKRLADLVRKESCADVAKQLGLGDDIELGAVGAAAAQARLRKSVLGDICEAVIGAIYLDGGYAAAAQFIARNWTERMQKPRRPPRDSKTTLQEWAQGKGLPTPIYREIERTGPHHDPQFRVAVELPGLAPAEGVGGNKRAAEKAAASAMIAREGVSGGNNDG